MNYKQLLITFDINETKNEYPIFEALNGYLEDFIASEGNSDYVRKGISITVSENFQKIYQKAIESIKNNDYLSGINYAIELCKTTNYKPSYNEYWLLKDIVRAYIKETQQPIYYFPDRDNKDIGSDRGV